MQRGIVQKPLATIILAVSAWPVLTQAAGQPGVSFAHNDWEIVCDNTRTCRAAGYQQEAGDNWPVSVLLTRKAGPHQPVTAQLQIGSYGDDDFLQKLPAKFTATMKIDGQPQGSVALSRKELVADLSPQQTEALLAALTRTSRIEWTANGIVWKLSGKGAAAVLLKMDEFQGRIGTTGALVRKGAKGEESVLPALEAPVVVAGPVPKGGAEDKRLAGVQGKAVADALRASMKGDNDCEELPSIGKTDNPLSLARLSDGKLLASALCWRAAYNEGYGYWVVNANAPYAPVLVTANGTDFRDGTISSVQKGRGLADCIGQEAWTWDGSRFVQTLISTSGMCRLVAPGGAWELPSFVATVRATGAR